VGITRLSNFVKAMGHRDGVRGGWTMDDAPTEKQIVFRAKTGQNAQIN
jgi:hypothetical protein